MNDEFLEKNIIVTGASRGLGLEICRILWARGANLLLTSRNADALDTARQELRSHGKGSGSLDIVAVDAKKNESVQTIMDSVAKHWNRVDGLVNNAAVLGPIGKLWENDFDDWKGAIVVNLLTPVELSRASIPWMIKAGRGKIVNLSGGGATGSRPNFSSYALAKTALVRFTEILAEETRDLSIQVNAMAPGAMNTAMLTRVLVDGPDKAGKNEYDSALRQIKNGGADPKNAAELCAFLLSSESDGITGKLISAIWDPWRDLPKHAHELEQSDIYTLRRITPKDRGLKWD